jgi:hypothetical protein
MRFSLATLTLAVVLPLAVGCGDDETTTTGAVKLSDEEKIEQTGNDWAVLFAAGGGASCKYQTQPVCERIACSRAGGSRIRNCKPPPSAFRKSFEGATVQDIAIKGDRAAATFSNGEAVELVHGGGFALGGVWWIDKLGGNAGKK